MARLAGFFLLWYCIASLSVIGFNFFGALKYNEVTYIGIVIFLFWGLVFLSQRELKAAFVVTRPRHLRLALYLLVFLIDALAVLALIRFGPSPVVGVLAGVDPDSLLLQGLYREQLPLRALGPPVTVAIGVFAYIAVQKNVISKLGGIIAALSIIFFVSVYETRHILIWISIYLIGLAVTENGLRKSVARAAKNWKLFLMVSLLFMIFKEFGEIRSGLSGLLEDAGPAFAEAMAVDDAYWHIGMSGLWVLIYAFSSVARGMENDPLYSMIDFVLPDKLFPGSLQFLTEDMHIASGLMKDRFSPQMFGVDAWHTYAANFGVLGSILFINIFFVFIFFLYKKLSFLLMKRPLVSSVYYFVVVWGFARLFLFPFGDYLLDFSAIVELLCIIFLARMGGLQIAMPAVAGANK